MKEETPESSDVPLLMELENKYGFISKKRVFEYNKISDNKEINTDACIDKEQENKNKCEVCLEHKFKYKCPLCKIKTCSLSCVNLHKERNNCKGKVDIKYASCLEDEKDLMKDVSYLTHMINRKNEVSKNNYELIESSKLKNDDDDGLTNKEKNKDKRLKNLIKLCKKFRSIKLERCPVTLSRFKENNSYCDSKNKLFHWTVRLYFLIGKNFESHIFTETFNDIEHSINSIIKKLLEIKEAIKSTNILTLLCSSDFIEGNYRVFNRIGKIEYQNLKLKRELKGEADNDDLLKLDDFSYFKNITNEERSDVLSNYLKDKTIRDYPEFYIILNDKSV